MEKNNVSYFLAGYNAALIEEGIYTEKEIKELEYNTIGFHNKRLEKLREYQDNNEL